MSNDSIDVLTDKIHSWGINKGILPNGDRYKQFQKTQEEVYELEDAIRDSDAHEAKDAIGDIFVTLVMQADCWGFTMQECIEQAWNEIKDRKGKMVDGQFIKDYNLL